MRIIFVGTASFAVPILEKLINTPEHQIICAVTQPDSCGGRGLKETVTPIKEIALKHKLHVFQPPDINEQFVAEEMKRHMPEAVILAAYGQIVSNYLLEIPKHGWINVHPSLLPKYRGAAPIAHSILNGDNITGVSIIKMVKKMDAGPILAQQSLIMNPDETALQLEKRLADLGAVILLDVIRKLETGETDPREQHPEEMTLAPCFKKEDGLINWTLSSAQIINHIRAMQPWPGAYTYYFSDTHKKIKVSITKANIALKEENFRDAPGIIVKVIKDALFVNTGKGLMEIGGLQPAGKKPMSARDFINGYRVKKGDRYGSV
jgi:methionyl-tRNA formyltransferase